MDLVLRNVLLVDGDAVVIADIGITDGRIAAVAPGLTADAEEMKFPSWIYRRIFGSG